MAVHPRPSSPSESSDTHPKRRRVSGSWTRPLEDPPLAFDLPPRIAAMIRVAAERWDRARQLVQALKPTLQRESGLVREILDTGLRNVDRRTMRRLTMRSAGEDAEEALQHVPMANREELESILERSKDELVRLSMTATSDAKEEILRESDEVLRLVRCALEDVREELHGAKSRSDPCAVRRAGKWFADVKAMMHRVEQETAGVTRNRADAVLLVTVCRRILPMRSVNPSELRNIEPSHTGYRRILDFFRFTDASLYCFGDYASGPNWFVRPRRNVAILLARSADGTTVYDSFAVSGELRTAGAALAPRDGPLRACEAEDEHGRVFDRQHDAEMKLLSGLCMAIGTSEGCRDWEGVATLWSRKPLCGSCQGVVAQVGALFPKLRLEIRVGDTGDG